MNRPLLAFVERIDPAEPAQGEGDVEVGPEEDGGEDQIRARRDVVLDLMLFDALPALLLKTTQWEEELARLPTAIGVGTSLSQDVVAGWRESSWVIIELRLDADTSIAELDLYSGLDDIEAPTRVQLVSFVAKTGIAKAANRAVGYSRIPIATDADLTKALAIAQPEMLAVYEVGQGVCQALCNHVSQPLLYVDFGGGCLANASSYPVPAPNFCYAQAPNVLLSHWDFDHWRSGQACTRSHARTWIAPKQKWGPTCGKFVASVLTGGGALLLWGKSSTPSLPAHLEIQRCTGKSRNDSGLAVTVEIARGGGRGAARIFRGTHSTVWSLRRSSVSSTTWLPPTMARRTRARQQRDATWCTPSGMGTRTAIRTGRPSSARAGRDGGRGTTRLRGMSGSGLTREQWQVLQARVGLACLRATCLRNSA